MSFEAERAEQIRRENEAMQRPSERARCPYCGKRVAVTRTGKLWTHLDPQTKRRCGRSGGRPS